MKITMLNHRILASLALFCLVVPFCMGQPTNAYTNDVSMAAPNAASLGKYVDIPVSYFTGVPNIEVPIYTVQDGPLSLPISLSYHASGVKPNEPASWVGTNWSLNAGGIVTRTILGQRDEAYLGYARIGHLLQGHPNIDQSNLGGVPDSEPDIFSFNFNGFSGKFFIAQENNSFKVFFTEKTDLKCIPDIHNSVEELLGFTFISPDGTRYIFGTEGIGAPTELREKSYNAGIPNIEYPTSWYLREIQSFDEKFKISFEYEDERYAFLTVQDQGYTEYYEMECDGRICEQGGNTSPYGDGYGENIVNGKRLKSIKTSTNLSQVDFLVAPEPRLDLSGTSGSFPNAGPIPNVNAKPLGKIKVAAGTFCKEWSMAYSYFYDDRTEVEDWLPSHVAAISRYHLKLDAIQEQSCDIGNQIQNPTTIFEYEGIPASYQQNGQTINTMFLPFGLTKEIDHWGFYNGKTQNNGHINWINAPPTTVSINGISLSFGFSDRETDPDVMKYGILKKVIYPTRGNVVYEYEANDVQTEWESNAINTILRLSTQSCCPVVSKDQNIAFTEDEISSGTTILSLEAKPSCIPCSPQAPYQVYYSLEIFQANEPTPFKTIAFNILSNQNNVEFKFKLWELANFMPGIDYRFKLTSIRGDGQFIIETPVFTRGNKFVGGLRIKKYTLHDGISVANDISNTYTYNEDGNSGKSSGRLYRVPKYGYGFSKKMDVGLSFHNKCTLSIARIFASPIAPLSSYQGFHVGYQRVVENLGGSVAGNGHKVYKFHTESGANLNNLENILSIPDPVAFKNGKIISESIVAATGTEQSRGSYVPDKYTHITVTPTIAYKWERRLVCQTFFTIDLAYIPLRRVHYRLISTESTLDGLTNNATLDYNDNISNFDLQRTQPRYISSYNSDGKIYVTEQKFAYDYDLDNNVKNKLLAFNMVGSPYETNHYVNGAHTNGARTEYGLIKASTWTWDNSGDYPYPRYFKNWEAPIGGGNPNQGSGKWATQGEVLEYYPSGLTKKFLTDGWADPHEYAWANGLITQSKFKNLAKQYTYHPGSRLLASIQDVDGQQVWFDYDPLMRLSNMYARPSTPGDKNTANIKKEYTYQYKTNATPNNVRTKTIYTPVAGSALSETEDIEYFDGLGRSIQHIGIKASPQLRDVITATIYDGQGRVVRQSTPFHAATTNGAYQPNFPHNLIPGAVTEYEASPLSRVKGVTPPGWYKTTTDYGTNTVPVTHPNGTQYPINTLMVTTVTDPNDNKNLTFKDKKGRTILSRRSDATGTQTADTYSSYDDKDRLTTVYPPGATNNTPDLLFSYQYDESDNVISKKVPDKAGETMQYDARDLQTLYQDGNMAANGHWMKTEYDDYGRPTKTGFTVNGVAFSELLTETFYDFAGRVSRTRAKILDEPSTNSWIEKNFGYDAYGRLVGTNENNHLNLTLGSQGSGMVYDFADNVLESSHGFQVNQTTQNNNKHRYAYDHRGRKISTFHQADNNPEVETAGMFYNHRNFMTAKTLHKRSASAWFQKLDFQYTAQGWLTSINGDCSSSASATEAITVENLAISMEWGAPIVANATEPAPLTLKVGVSGVFTSKEGAAQPFSTGSWLQVSHQGTDSVRTDRLAAQPAQVALTDTVRLDWTGQTIGFDGLATFYAALRQRFVEMAGKKVANPGDLVVYANAVQAAAEETLAPLSVYAANQVQAAIKAVPNQQKGTLVETAEPDLFHLSINYDAPNPTLNAPQNKNGNITSIQYGCDNAHVYGFQYDFLDRMTKGTYAFFQSSSGYSRFNKNNEEVLSYDPRGNILRLKRNSEESLNPSLEIDNLTYTYSSNRLTQIAESGAPGPSQAWYWMHGFKTGSGTAGYGYDDNGNMVSDGHKGMSVEYNHLNLPKRFTFAEGKWIKILYDASGTKLKMESSTGAQTHYAGDLEYGLYGNSPIKLRYFYHDEGRCAIEGTTYVYDYSLKDHLGSTHLVAREDGVFDLSQESMYYPFGLLWEGLHGVGQRPDNRYTYNGKEWNREHGLEWYDYGARWYDAAVGRWWSGDPRPEYEYSTYQSLRNNPLLYIDLAGDTVYLYSAIKNGKATYTNGQIAQIAFAAALVDLKNGIDNTYVITTGKDIEDGKHTLDREVDLVYEINEDMNTDGPGFTFHSEGKKGEGFHSGGINPDHRSFRMAFASADRRFFNAGIALSHEVNTHGYANKVQMIGKGNNIDDHNSNCGDCLDEEYVSLYHGSMTRRGFQFSPSYALSAKNKPNALAILQLEKAKAYKGPGRAKFLYDIYNKINNLSKNMR